MSWKLRVLVPAILAAPQAAFALGLGDIRLNSALNEPLSAEIDLVAATPDEIDAVRAQLASRELFERYGLDRASYLDSVTFRVGKGRDGRSVLLVRSSAPIGEPFVTFLVEVNWPRGKLLREYTVLLDPPVFAPAEATRAPAVAAPRVVSQTPAPSTAPTPPPRAPAPVTGEAPVTAPATRMAEPLPASRPERPTAYRVERNDTLYQIAATLTDGSRRETQRMMIALFRANPGAFDGNINRLRQGETLQVPGADEVAAIGGADAAQEISRQMAEWRGAAPAVETGRLKLVTPQEGAMPAGATAGEADGEVRARVQQLEQELAESRRLLELKNAELAALQRKLEGTAVPSSAGAEPPAAPEAGPAETPAAAGPAAAPPAPKQVRKKETSPASAAAEPSLVDRLTDQWGYLVGAAGVVLIGLLGFGFLRRRREDEFDDAIASAGAGGQSYGATTVARGPGAERPEAILVEEDRSAVESAPTAASGSRLEDTFSSESAVNIDHADPLAEADFHMAYGLHDQAADLIKLALEKEPHRRDLKNKLLEVYFVWGNKERFIEVARDLQATRQDAPPGEWERVVIMGRQIAPEHALFAGTVSTAAMGAMDVNLEGGQTRIDLELLSPPPTSAGVDLDLGRPMGEGGPADDTGRGEMLDLDLGMPPSAASPTTELPTVEMPQPSEPTAELPTVEMPTSDAGTATAEQPWLDRAVETVRQRLDTPPVQAPSVDATAELSVDDLGIDLGELDALTRTTETPVPDIEDTSTMLTQLSEEDEATRLAPHIRVEQPDAAASDRAGEHDVGRTEVLPQLSTGDGDQLAEVTEIAAAADFGTTELTPVLETTAEKPALDLDLGDAAVAESFDLAPTARLNLGGLDQTQTARIDVTDMPQLAELEPVTLSEVGTKLDLARAYMDMGDPDGARSILQEVLAEGSASQKQEAQRLIDALPGVA